MQPLLPWLLALACVCWLTWAEEVGCRRSSSALYTESMGELLHKSIVYVRVCANVCIICREHAWVAVDEYDTYKYVRVCVCPYAHMCICMHVYMPDSWSVCVQAWKDVWKRKRLDTLQGVSSCINTHAYICKYICIHIYVYEYIYICIHIHICIYTYINM